MESVVSGEPRLPGMVNTTNKANACVCRRTMVDHLSLFVFAKQHPDTLSGPGAGVF